MGDVTLEQVADAMFELVKSSKGKRDLKPMDVTKAMIEQFGGNVDKTHVQEGTALAHRHRQADLQVRGRELCDPALNRIPGHDGAGRHATGPAPAPLGGDMAKKKGPERIKEAIEILRKWQAIERDAIETTASIMEKTDNLLIRQVMEIIRNDSVQHHRVQQFLIDTMTKAPVTLTSADLAEIWGEIEAHDELERETIALARQLKESTTDPVHKILLDYLLADETKHDTILGELDEFKKHMSKLS